MRERLTNIWDEFLSVRIFFIGHGEFSDDISNKNPGQEPDFEKLIMKTVKKILLLYFIRHTILNDNVFEINIFHYKIHENTQLLSSANSHKKDLFFFSGKSKFNWSSEVLST